MLDYKKEFERWKKADLLDFDLGRELELISGNEEEIKEHFGRALEFGTAGIRGTLGVGTNRMTLFVVGRRRRGSHAIFWKRDSRNWLPSAMTPG